MIQLWWISTIESTFNFTLVTHYPIAIHPYIPKNFIHPLNIICEFSMDEYCMNFSFKFLWMKFQGWMINFHGWWNSLNEISLDPWNVIKSFMSSMKYNSFTIWFHPLWFIQFPWMMQCTWWNKVQIRESH
jgi:hypothetical protein